MVSSMAFTLKDRPATFAEFSPYLSPWIDSQSLGSKGVAAICSASNAACLQSMAALANGRPAGRRIDVELTPRWLGLTGQPGRFVIAIMLPP
jgi:hypothetical protein